MPYGINVAPLPILGKQAGTALPRQLNIEVASDDENRVLFESPACAHPVTFPIEGAWLYSAALEKGGEGVHARAAPARVRLLGLRLSARVRGMHVRPESFWVLFASCGTIGSCVIGLLDNR